MLRFLFSIYLIIFCQVIFAAEKEVVVSVFLPKEFATDINARLAKSAAASNGVTTRKKCLVRNGKWLRMGMAAQFGCSLPTPDGGKECNDDDQCAMYCEPTRHEIGKPYKLTGFCRPNFDIFGCQSGMKNGRPTVGEVCVD